MNNFYDFIEAIKKEDLKSVKQLFQKEFIKEKYTGWSALHVASTFNNKDGIVQYLLSKGCNIEEEYTYSKERCIHLAAREGKVNVLKKLIMEGCDIKSLTNKGESAWDLALRFMNEECAEILKSFKDDLELIENNNLSMIIDQKISETLLDKFLNNTNKRIMAAIKSKPVNDEEINDLRNLKLRKLNPQSYGLLQECLLARCLYQRYEDGVYDLCKASLVNKKSIFMERTALETSVECKVTASSVKSILWKLVKADESWKRAEHIAERVNNERSLNLIKTRREFLKNKEKEGFSRLQIAVLENDPDMIDYMMKNKRVEDDEDSKKGGAALSLSYSIGHMECVESLQNNNVNVNTFDKFRQTPLHMAIYNRRQQHSEYLVNNLINLEDEDFMNFTVLERSVMNDCEDICQRLVMKEARCDRYIKIDSKWLSMDSDLRMILHNLPYLPVTNCETIYTLCFKVNGKVYPSLLSKMDRRSIDLTDGDGNTLLHLCAISLNKQLSSNLLFRLANINAKNKLQRTPLLELLINNYNDNEIRIELMETVEVLIDRGASVNVMDSNQCSILKIATKYNDEKLLLTLLRNNEFLEYLEKPIFLDWLNKKYYTFLKEVSPFINKSLLQQWISIDMIEICIQDEDLIITKSLYHSACCTVQINVIEKILLKAALKGDMKLFKEIILDDISPDTILYEEESLLNHLIKARKKEFISQIISSKHFDVFLEKSDRENKLPLHVCIECEYWEVIDRLITDTKSVNKEDNDGNTPLSLLLSKMSDSDDDELNISLMGYVKNLILKSADIFKVNKHNKTVLSHLANPNLKFQIESFFLQIQNNSQYSKIEPIPTFIYAEAEQECAHDVSRELNNTKNSLVNAEPSSPFVENNDNFLQLMPIPNDY